MDSRNPSDKRSYFSLVAAQALGSFNDNFLKQFLIFFALASVEESSQKTEGVRLGTFATVVYLLPFILFSAYSGSIADAFSKRSVVVWAKAVEAVLMGAAIAAFAGHSYPFLVLILFLMAAQSAFFSPAKYGMLPEILSPGDLARGNGVLEMANFIAIILGIVAAGLLYEAIGTDLHLAGVVLV
ncbi:MAG TPA: MFS transporter, partial [Planctomycetota bacterium]|nr:MFS transporter [Planctomycetota bacterium]